MKMKSLKNLGKVRK